MRNKPRFIKTNRFQIYENKMVSVKLFSTTTKKTEKKKVRTSYKVIKLYQTHEILNNHELPYPLCRTIHLLSNLHPMVPSFLPQALVVFQMAFFVHNSSKVVSGTCATFGSLTSFLNSSNSSKVIESFDTELGASLLTFGDPPCPTARRGSSLPHGSGKRRIHRWGWGADADDGRLGDCLLHLPFFPSFH